MKFCQGCLLQSPSGIHETKYLMHFKHVHANVHRGESPLILQALSPTVHVIQVRESQAISCFDIQMLLLVTGHLPVLLKLQPPCQHVSSLRPRRPLTLKSMVRHNTIADMTDCTIIL